MNLHDFSPILLLVLLGIYSTSYADDTKDETNTKDEKETEKQKDKEVVVTGSKTEILLKDSTVAVDVITRKDIEEFGAGDVIDLLQQQSGLFINRSILGASPMLQGLDPKHTLVLINGQRMLGAKDGVIDLSRVSLTNIERIEMVKGASSVLYGSDAMGGVINIITRQAVAPLVVEGRYLQGTYGTLQADGNIGANRKKWSTLFSFNHRKTDGYDLDPSTIQTDGPQYVQTEVQNKSRYTPKRNIDVETNASYVLRDSRRVNANGLAVLDQGNRVEDARVQIKPSWRPNTNSKLSSVASASIYRDQYLSDQRRATTYDRFQENIQQLGVFGLQYDHFLKGHFLSEGIEAQFEYIQSDRLADRSARRERFAFFVQDQWDDVAGQDVQLLTGLRLDSDSWFGFYPTPKIAVRFDPAKTIKLRAGYGWGYRAPSFREMFLLFENPSVGYVVEGNPDLKQETSQSLNAGAEYSNVLFSFMSNLYRNNIHDLINVNIVDSPSGPLLYRYENISEAYTQGVELTSNVRLSRRLKLNMSYHLTDTQNITCDHPLSGRALHSGTAGVGFYTKRGTSITSNASYVGSRRFYFATDGDDCTKVDKVVADPYTMLNIRAEQRVARFFSTFMGVNNLLDAGEADYLPIQPRWFYFGLSGQFPRGKR